MPLAAMTSTLKTQLDAAVNAGIAGNPALMATQITTAVASILPSGLFTGVVPPIPPPPAGFPAMQAQLNSIFNSGVGGNPTLSATQMAQAVSVLSPIVPPTGLPILIQALNSIFNLGIAGKPSVVTPAIAAAIIAYFTAGLVI